MRVHTGKALIAAAAALALGLTACSSSGGGNSNPSSSTGNNSSSSNSSTDPNAGKKGTGALASCVTDPNGCNSGKTKPGGTIRYVLEKTIPGWNQVLSTSNVFELAEVEDGILPGAYINGPDLKPFLNTDLMGNVDSKTTGGKQVITYNVKPTAVWNDGSPINFDDFQYLAWTSDGTHCPKCGAASSAGYNAIESMKSSNNGKTVTVTMKTPYADWQSMFGALLPAHIAKQHGGTSGASGLLASFTWFDKNVPTYSGGPMVITNYQKDTSITEKPNPKWYGAVKSSLDSLIFRIITDQTQEPTALQGGEVDAAYPQPNADLVQRISQIPNLQTFLGKGLVWEHFDFNEKNKFLSDKQLRLAVFTAINRQDVITRTIGQFVQGAGPLNNHMYVPGQPGYQDNVTSTGQGSGDIAKAKQILQTAGYTGIGSTLKTKAGAAVTFRCTYSAGNTNRQTECETVQNTLQQLGIKVTLKTTTDLSELGNGNFDMIVFAWQSTPFVVAGAQQIW
ncbi:MAG TPA: ABC transporter family substrate-binding protein, partial [Jatrophihabitans sp.]|nr:ABC transporter family substrate-binding protein [Jatrophihabitans sp.]